MLFSLDCVMFGDSMNNWPLSRLHVTSRMFHYKPIWNKLCRSQFGFGEFESFFIQILIILIILLYSIISAIMRNLLQMWFDDVLDHGMCSRSHFVPHIFFLGEQFLYSLYLSFLVYHIRITSKRIYISWILQTISYSWHYENCTEICLKRCVLKIKLG